MYQGGPSEHAAHSGYFLGCKEPHNFSAECIGQCNYVWPVDCFGLSCRGHLVQARYLDLNTKRSTVCRRVTVLVLVVCKQS